MQHKFIQTGKREMTLIDLNGNDGFELKYKWKCDCDHSNQLNN